MTVSFLIPTFGGVEASCKGSLSLEVFVGHSCLAFAGLLRRK